MKQYYRITKSQLDTLMEALHPMRTSNEIIDKAYHFLSMKKSFDLFHYEQYIITYSHPGNRNGIAIATNNQDEARRVLNEVLALGNLYNARMRTISTMDSTLYKKIQKLRDQLDQERKINKELNERITTLALRR